MKVKIEFAEPEPGEDRESEYDSVELTTLHAGSIEGWADAVLGILRPAMWSSKAILLCALIEESDTRLQKDSNFVQKYRDYLQDLRDELNDILDSETNI